MANPRGMMRRTILVLAASLAAVLLPISPAHANPAAGPNLWLSADKDVTVSNSKVNHWADRSGNGLDATMTVVARQPLLVTSAINGLPVIRFSGAQSLNLLTPTSPNPFTIFIVGKNSKPTESFSMILGPGGNFPNNQIRWENSSQALFVGTGNALPTTVSPIGNTRVFHELSARYDGSTMRIFRDGNLVSSRSFRTTGPFTLASIGSYYSHYFMIGDIAEIIVYSSALSDVDRITTDNYLRTKYALP